VGLRYEWLGQEFDGDQIDFHELTIGWNHRRSANLIIRPEVRWDWINVDGFEDDHASFAMDAIMTF
ncbi:MAG: porin, partial [Rubripirellula sp.]|nr:porin [Rubripirellula sp.]